MLRFIDDLDRSSIIIMAEDFEKYIDDIISKLLIPCLFQCEEEVELFNKGEDEDFVDTLLRDSSSRLKYRSISLIRYFGIGDARIKYIDSAIYNLISGYYKNDKNWRYLVAAINLFISYYSHKDIETNEDMKFSKENVQAFRCMTTVALKKLEGENLFFLNLYSIKLILIFRKTLPNELLLVLPIYLLNRKLLLL